jgi:hypothetical protein
MVGGNRRPSYSAVALACGGGRAASFLCGGRGRLQLAMRAEAPQSKYRSPDPVPVPTRDPLHCRRSQLHFPALARTAPISILQPAHTTHTRARSHCHFSPSLSPHTRSPPFCPPLTRSAPRSTRCCAAVPTTFSLTRRTTRPSSASRRRTLTRSCSRARPRSHTERRGRRDPSSQRWEGDTGGGRKQEVHPMEDVSWNSLSSTRTFLRAPTPPVPAPPTHLPTHSSVPSPLSTSPPTSPRPPSSPTTTT